MDTNPPDPGDDAAAFELLRLAAAAAGIEYDRAVSGPGQGRPSRWGGLWRTDIARRSAAEPWWSPLHDDGGALRAAVAVPHLNLQWIIAEAWQAHEDEPSRRAYVRRAITVALAEIGRAVTS